MPRPEQNTKRTLLANSAYIFLIRFFPALASLLAMVLLSRSIDTSLYGHYQHFWVHWQVYNAIVCLGIPALLLTYPWEKINQLITRIKRRSLFIFSGWLLAVSIIFGFTQFPGFTLFYSWFAFLFLIVSAGVAIMEAYLIVGKKFGYIVVLSLAYAILFAVVHWLFIHGMIIFQELFLYLLSGNIARLFFLFAKSTQLYNKRTLEIEEVPVSNIRSLWFHLGVYDIIQTVFRWADKLILSSLLSSGLFAIYFNGTIDVPFLALMLGAVGSALLMRMSDAHTSDEDRAAILRNSSSKLALIVFPLFLFLILFRHELFAVVFANRYPESVPLFLISSLVIPLRAYNFTSILQHKGRGKIINAGAMIDITLAIVLMYPMYLLWNLNGIALAFVISTYVQAGFYLWHTARLLHCPISKLLPLRSWLINAIVFSIIFIALYYSLRQRFNPRNVLLLGGSFMALIILIMLLPTFLKKNPNAYKG